MLIMLRGFGNAVEIPKVNPSSKVNFPGLIVAPSDRRAPISAAAPICAARSRGRSLDGLWDIARAGGGNLCMT
jgi:hypothetical protein